MNTIMEDPVILPHSKINIDRNTIVTYLLTNPIKRKNYELFEK